MLDALRYTGNPRTASALQRRVKRHRKKFEGEEKAKTSEMVPVPKRIKVVCGGSLVSSLTTTSSDEFESGQTDSRITTMVSAKAVEQEAAASKLDSFSAAVGILNMEKHVPSSEYEQQGELYICKELAHTIFIH